MYVSSTALIALSNFSARVVCCLTIIFNEYLLCCYSAVHLTTYAFSSVENLIISGSCCHAFTHGFHTVLISLGHSSDDTVSCLYKAVANGQVLARPLFLKVKTNCILQKASNKQKY